MAVIMLLAALLGLSLLLLVSPIKVHVRYAVGDEKGSDAPFGNGIRLSFLWGLFSLRLRVAGVVSFYRVFLPVMKLRARMAGRPGGEMAEEKMLLTPARVCWLLRRVARLGRLMAPAGRRLLSAVQLHRFCWRTGIGLQEADLTGITTGILWIIKGNLISGLYRLVKKPAPRPVLEIMPFYNHCLVRVYLNCIFSLRLGHIISAVILAGWLYLRNRKKVRG